MDGIFLLLGSNIGDRISNLQRAQTLIGTNQCKVLRYSKIYTTAAWGKTDQPDFLNQVLEVSTSLAPLQLLETILQIEQTMGRRRIEKWGERIIDIDILFYGRQILDTSKLQIPHPHIAERRFTLVPLVELAPGFVHPVLNLSNTSLLNKCSDPLDVEPLNDTNI
ncbi:MAG: 2-amino-4-hydroxy-6-hydroxymethyldihydropteridine diphosphokinase [Bacteroidota bacterium]